MAPRDSCSVNRCDQSHLACNFPLNMTVPIRARIISAVMPPVAAMLDERGLLLVTQARIELLRGGAHRFDRIERGFKPGLRAVEPLDQRIAPVLRSRPAGNRPSSSRRRRWSRS